jgi:hypothetical protein
MHDRLDEIAEAWMARDEAEQESVIVEVERFLSENPTQDILADRDPMTLTWALLSAWGELERLRGVLFGDDEDEVSTDA